MLAVALVALAAPTAFAVKPVTEPLVGWEGTDSLTGYCAFPITVDYKLTGTVTSFYDGNGVLIKQEYHFYEVDTFSANGKTGVSGERVNAQWIYDSSGNLLKEVDLGNSGGHRAARRHPVPLRGPYRLPQPSAQLRLGA